MQDDLTTLVCLFHHADQAEAAIRDLKKAGVPDSAISLTGGDGQGVDDLEKAELSSLGMPDRDYDHLKQGIRDGGFVVAVASISDHVSKVESIFAAHHAEKIDEADVATSELATPAVIASEPAASDGADEAVIPIVQEDLVVGKRTVDQGGVRLYRRVIEVPVQESINLREEHVSVDRVAVDRPISDADGAFQERTIALKESAEEAVVTKDARVVEEVFLTKDVSERTETVHDTVRHTEIETEDLPGTGATASNPTRTY